MESRYNAGMKRVFACLLIAAAALALGQRIEKSIGGLSVDRSGESIYDSVQKLYLYSGGD